MCCIILICSIGKRNDEEGAKEKLFTYASHVPVTSFKVRTMNLKVRYISPLIRTCKLWLLTRSELVYICDNDIS